MSQLRFFNTPLTAAASPSRRDVMGLLEAFCREVQQVTQGAVTCALVPGFTTGLGQEYRATAHSQSKNIDHILFRAYVPIDGVPLNFDFYEDEMKRCGSVDEVRSALEGFAQRDATRETLRLLGQ